MTPLARIIFWAQIRSWLNYYPKAGRVGSWFGMLLTGLWYLLWVGFALIIYRVFSEPGSEQLVVTALPAGLLFVSVYWQVVPLLLAATGVSLEMKKLQVYPIPHRQLFLIELLLRLTTSVEALVVVLGLGAGLLANPRLPWWAATGLIPFIAFNLAVSAGVREILMRLLARKRVREMAVLLLVSIGAIPQLLVATGAWNRVRDWYQSPSNALWPWSAAAAIATGHPGMISVVVLLAWAALAYAFGRHQFEKSLRWDAAEGNATKAEPLPAGKRGFLDRLLGWPALLFADPLASLVEKELRFLSRAPRFRLVFTMGFTFGLIIWLPITLGHGRGPSFLGRNYLTFVSVYALLLLGDVCFWNVFGFDRSAAQAYWAMPVKFSKVLAGKNVAAAFYILLEVTFIIAACALVRMPVTAPRVLEAYAVTVVVGLYLVALGNMTSVRSPRSVNPSKAMRSGAAGKLQAMLFVLYPLAALPVALAYAARYAFRSEVAFFGTLFVSVLIGAAVYWVALESAVETAEKDRERIITALSQGEGIIQA